MAIVTCSAGESHGKSIIGIISGVPAGLKVDGEEINRELARRMLGLGRGPRMKIESDTAEIISGVQGHYTTGAPIALKVDNADYAAWRDVIGAEATGSKPLTAVRPGHADFAGAVKYGQNDARSVSERASARSTVMTVALGAIAKMYLRALGIDIFSHTLSIGIIEAKNYAAGTDINERADRDPVRCLDGAASEKMVEEIRSAALAGDTLGGKSEIIVHGIKSGVGSVMSEERRLDGIIMGAVGAVPSVKAVEIGDGIKSSALLGSAAHDELFVRDGKIVRMSNRAGGIEGGMSDGEDIVIHAYFKPLPTVKKGLSTVDLVTRKEVKSAVERSDICIVPAGGVVVEHAVAIALVKALSDMLGSDTMDEVIARYETKGGVYD